MGKTSLANTLETFLKSPTKSPESWSWLSEHHPELLCTQVIQLYDGLSINNNEEELAVEVGDHAHNVKLVKLKMAQNPEVSVDRGKTPSVQIKVSKRKRFLNWFKGKDKEEDTLGNNNQTNVQVKLVDLGGHTAMV